MGLCMRETFGTMQIDFAWQDPGIHRPSLSATLLPAQCIWKFEFTLIGLLLKDN